MIEIPYNKRTLRFGPISGGLFILFGVLGLIFQEVKWPSMGMIIISVIYLFHTCMMYYNKYLIIDKHILKISTYPFLKKQIDLREVNKIKYFGRSYTLQTSNKKLSINTDLINTESKSILEDIFNSLKAERV